MADEILIRFSVKDDGSPVIEKVNKKLGETAKQSKALVPGLESARESLTGFASQNAALIGVLVGVGAAIKNVIDEGIKYAMTVDEMARAGGQSAEEASRFLQVLDDYEISAQDALAATRALTNNGLAPNIETLAKLADKYNTLNTVEDKNKFIIENLGRGGLAWAKALEQGSAALLEQAAAVDKNLILTQKQVQQAEAARLAIDNWNDSIQGLKTSLAMDLLPTLANYLNYTKKIEDVSKSELNVFQKQAEGFKLQWQLISDLVSGKTSFIEVTEESTDANDEYSQSVAEVEAAEKAAKDAAKALSDELSSRISLINSIQSSEDTYAANSKKLTSERIAIEQKISDVQARGWEKSVGELQGYQDELADVKNQEAELAKEREKQTLQFVSNILAEQLARDGWTQAEFDAFAAQQQAWGLWSSDVVAKSQAAWQEAMKITDAINGIPTDKTINIYYQKYGDAGDTAQTQAGGYAYQYTKKKPNAGGGSFMLPFGGGNESFVLPGGNTASPGETVTIDKAGSVSRTDELLEKLLRKETINEGRFVRKMLAAMQQGQGQ